MHPSFVLLLWSAAVLVLQMASGKALLVLFLVVAAAAWLWARPLGWRLVRRIRFLLLALFILFGLFTPGRALIPALPWGPSVEGVSLALEHAARLVSVVCAVALLLSRLSPDRLVSALYGLMLPFRRLGLPAHRVALRILLVLREVADPPAGGWRAWLASLHLPPADSAPVRLEVRRFSLLESAILWGGAAVCACLFWMVV